MLIGTNNVDLAIQEHKFFVTGYNRGSCNSCTFMKGSILGAATGYIEL